MATLIQAPLNLPVGMRNFRPDVPADVREIAISMTTGGWPAGECLAVDILYPDGALAGTVGFAGGVLNKHGQALCSCGLRGSHDTATGLRMPLPSGRYTVRANVLQAISTTITVEAT